MLLLGFEILGVILFYYAFQRIIKDDCHNSENRPYYIYQPPPLYEDINQEDSNINNPVDPPPQYD